MSTTTVRLRSETKAKLDDLKIHPRETYDDEPLSEEEIEAIRRSEEEIRAGRVRSLREVLRDLGDDPTGGPG